MEAKNLDCSEYLLKIDKIIMSETKLIEKILSPLEK